MLLINTHTTTNAEHGAEQWTLLCARAFKYLLSNDIFPNKSTLIIHSGFGNMFYVATAPALYLKCWVRCTFRRDLGWRWCEEFFLDICNFSKSLDSSWIRDRAIRQWSSAWITNASLRKVMFAISASWTDQSGHCVLGEVVANLLPRRRRLYITSSKCHAHTLKLEHTQKWDKGGSKRVIACGGGALCAVKVACERVVHPFISHGIIPEHTHW